MYKLMKDGVCLGRAEIPTYVKLAGNGCFNLCTEPEAAGIVYNGSVYHLLGRAELPGCESVMLETSDAGNELNEIYATMSDTDAMAVEHEYRLTLMELGLTESE